MITIKDLGFSYGERNVLKNINMTLEEGRIYGLLGENGVGKTTLLTLLCGLKKPQEGSVDADGHTPFKRETELLSSQYYLSDDVATVNMKAIDYAADYGRFWEGFSMEKFVSAMKDLETDPQLKMNKMSYGQLKKTYISFALACNAKFLYMDEPTNGLDIPSKAQFRKAVTKYTREDSIIVISTHQVRDLENIIDPIIILDRQDVLLNATIEEISKKLHFDYTNNRRPDSLYSEMIPGGSIQVSLNTDEQDSKVNIEALFNTVHLHKELIKGIFSK
ncbi:MAG: ATP-binding cassette domain-containing protein [Bacteroidales bacterium]|nr:ATP-binding cassette domain-containing protein [Bacteroidales bacterium]MBQ6689891.1 ATP-binding cassette domain-containing protein [Bacteroidales bacterium]